MTSVLRFRKDWENELRKTAVIITVCMCVLLAGCTFSIAAAGEECVVDKIDVAPVWSGHSVGFCLLTYGDDQFATFYDKDRQMTLAQRKLNERTWKLTKLPQKVGWDSHNYITMAVDNNGYLHLCGNMHVNPLVYFRSKKPLDISEMINVGHMVGTQEEHVTYPRFMNGPNTELIFTYRDGKSGSGNQIYNVYNEKTQSWSRLLDKPLIDGEGKRNAYIDGPVLGPDGWYHMCWVWRDTPDCSTNHDPSYTKSPDMLHWYTSAGKLLELPITYETAEIVDHVPVRDGLINSNVRIGFDSQKRPIITYHKYDKDGNTQIYDARLESGVWKTHRITDWKYRWWFEGGRSIQSEIGLSAVMPYGPGKIAQTFSHKKYGSKRLVIDEQTMQIVSNTKTESAIIRKPEGNFPGLMVKTGNDIGKCSEDGVRYMLCWETLGANYDKPREGEMPPPSMLRVYKIKKS